jgi:hypothetical protein
MSPSCGTQAPPPSGLVLSSLASFLRLSREGAFALAPVDLLLPHEIAIHKQLDCFLLCVGRVHCVAPVICSLRWEIPSIANGLLTILVVWEITRSTHAAHAHTYVRAHTRARTPTHVHTRTRTRTPTHSHAHTHAHAHANTRYGGIANEYVRDGSGMIIGMLELGPDRWDVARKAMRYMLQQLQVRFGRGLSHSTLDVVHTHTHTHTHTNSLFRARKTTCVLTNAVQKPPFCCSCSAHRTLRFSLDAASH